LPPHPDDLALFGTLISHLEHADDLLLISSSAEGLQRAMNLFLHWCRSNFLIINALKSKVCIHGPHAGRLPRFAFGDKEVEIFTKYTYLGITFQTGTPSLFGEHYKTKANSALTTAHAILHVESMIGTLSPAMGKDLYSARIDPQLTQGCEIMPDATHLHIERLLAVQKLFIRRLLGVYARSLVAPLFTETGIWALQYRRLELTLRYLKYLLQSAPNMLVHAAIRDNLALASAGQKSWTSDLKSIDELIASVKPTMIESLEQELQGTFTKSYLMCYRIEKQPDGNPTYVVFGFRHYLKIQNAKHRRSLTRLLFSCHDLAVERLSWKTRYTASTPREQRTCRFGCSEIETPEHALLRCQRAEEVCRLRSQ
ncbi:hypothetical protein AURDEDRAFT_27592, partial [Auricularia subglabra TFB-10046 SS5]